MTFNSTHENEPVDRLFFLPRFFFGLERAMNLELFELLSHDVPPVFRYHDTIRSGSIVP